MSDVRALAAALVYLDGLGEAGLADAEGQAAILVQQFAERGYVVRAPSGSPLEDRSPANLLATRRALGLQARAVAREAGVSVGTVYTVERPDRSPQARSVEAVAAALTRLGTGKL